MIGIVVDESASFTIGLLTWITRVDYPRPAALKAYKKVLCHLKSGKWHRKFYPIQL